MPIFDVHAYIPVRVKVTGVEADNQRAAIDVVENDNPLQWQISNRITRSYDDKISYIEPDDGSPAVGYLVDVVGDTEFDHSISYDVDQATGEIHAIGNRPGERQAVSQPILAALQSHADGKHLEVGLRSANLMEMKNSFAGVNDPVAKFLVDRLGGHLEYNRLTAIRAIDDAIADLQKVRDRLVDLPVITARQLDPEALSVKVYSNSNKLGTLSRQPGASWDDAILHVSGDPDELTYGLKSSLYELAGSNGFIQVVLSTADGEYAVYASADVREVINPHRITKGPDGKFNLLRHGHSAPTIHKTLEAAIFGASYDL